MRTYVISTTLNDVHAAAVAVSLRRLGYKCIRWISTDIPKGQQSTIAYGETTTIKVVSSDGEFILAIDPKNTVFWNRRIMTEPNLPENIHIGDREACLTATKHFRDDILSLLNTSYRRINDVYHSHKARSKALQLHTAKKLGFTIPETIISNCPESIRKFIDRQDYGMAVAKLFRSNIWRTATQDFISHTACVDSGQLPSDEIIRACPMIFQRRALKKYEVRITVFGDDYLAVKLDSQADVRSALDWRAVSPSDLNISRIPLPEQVLDKCKRLMRNLKLRFGCIDMIVTPDDKWIFLEINQMGQFLWIQEANRNIPALEMFVNFFIGKPSRHHDFTKLGMDFSSIMSDAYELLESDKPHRIPRLCSEVFEG